MKMKLKHNKMRWLLAVILLIWLCDIGLTSHAQGGMMFVLSGNHVTSDTTDTITPPNDTTDTVLPPPNDTTDTVLPPPNDTTDTVLPPPNDTTDTVLPPPNDTTDTVLPPPNDTTDTVLPPINLYLTDSLLLILPDSGAVMIPATFMILDSVSVQLGNDTLPAIDTLLQGTLILPEYLYRDSLTYCVRAIGSNAFRCCGGIEKIDIPPTVTDVGEYAFYQDTTLNQIYWDADESQLTRIGPSAFSETGLQEVTLPKRLQEIGDSAFAGCGAMTLLNFGDSLQYIGRRAFENCSSLQSIHMRGKLHELSAGAFSGCSSMTDLSLPDSLIHVGDSAFAGCAQLFHLSLNDSLQSIGRDAFTECHSLVEVKLPARVTGLDSGAFSYCEGLQRFITGDSLREMNDGVLAGDSSLRYVDLRQSRKLQLTEMSRDSGMFAGIPQITLLYLPNGNDSIQAVNAINTIANCVTMSAGLEIDGTFIDKNQSIQGMGTHMLNQYYGENVFGQMVGDLSRFDNYPLPYSECPMAVHRVQFYLQGRLCYTQYVNDSNVINKPSRADLDIAANVLLCKYIDAEGNEQEFVFTTPIVSDMDFEVIYGYTEGDVNYDGIINVLDVTSTINKILGIEPELFINENADLDGDATINVNDVTALINRILHADEYVENPTLNLRVLCLGNSYACDAYSYVPYIMRNVAPKVRLTLGILNTSNSSLSTHLYNHLLADSVYEYYYKFNILGKWRGIKDSPVQTALDDEKWDIVILQQSSAMSRDYALYQPELDSLIMILKDRLRDTLQINLQDSLQDSLQNNLQDSLLQVPKFGWLLTPAYPENQEMLNGSTSDEMFYDVAACADSVLNKTDVSFIIPVGTAIQNARTTELDQLGRTQHLTYDRWHLQEGIPCLIAAYTVTQTLINELGINASIYTDELNVTESWLKQYAIMQLNGTPVGMTPTYRELAKFCANMAIKRPYEIVDCSWFIQW